MSLLDREETTLADLLTVRWLDCHWILGFLLYLVVDSYWHEGTSALAAILCGERTDRFTKVPAVEVFGGPQPLVIATTVSKAEFVRATPYMTSLIQILAAWAGLLRVELHRCWTRTAVTAALHARAEISRHRLRRLDGWALR